MRYLHRGILLIFTVIGLLPVSPQEQGLYSSKAPEDKAFIRIINTGDETVDTLPVGAVMFRGISTGEVSPYRPLSPGISIIRTGDREAELIAKKKSFYTIVLTPESLFIINDKRHEDSVDAQLVLYNLTDREQISLRTSDGSTDIIPEAGLNQSASVNVNPVDAAMTVFSGKGKIADLGEKSLESGQSYSIFLLEGADGSAHLFVKAEIQTGK
jgi:alginate O-acetyltransferase complex protein AlgF